MMRIRLVSAASVPASAINSLDGSHANKNTHTLCGVSARLEAKRGVIQSAGSAGLRSPVDQYDDRLKVQQLGRNAAGNYYRFQQKLWPHTEALERELTRLHYGPVERTPLSLLPRRAPPQRRFLCEGRGATALLEQTEREMQEATHDQLTGTIPSSDMPSIADDDAAMEEMLAAAISQNVSDAPLAEKIMTDADIEGTVLASARERAREAILGDLITNTTTAAADAVSTTAREDLRRTARDTGGATWTSVGLDPVLSAAARDYFGAAPTRLQTRLLPALLNADHNDVVLNGVTGSGKTAALLLALLQGARSESAGLNVLVASNTITAMRAYDTLQALARRCGGGGKAVDRSAQNDRWLYLGTEREEYRRYYADLRRSLRLNSGREMQAGRDNLGVSGEADGAYRIFITTADVLCELLFEKKMEFKDFGYLRRLYVDDVGAQLPMLADNAPTEDVRERLRNPLAADLLLGTVHQMPGPHVRSLLQLGLVSADMDSKLKDHLKALCVKPDAHTIIMSPVRLASTIHCLFSFHLKSENKYDHVAEMLWSARETIPGRCVIFVHEGEDMLSVRRDLRARGINAKIFSEVYADGAFQDKWKFLLLKESEAFGTDIPQVSHVVVTFAPASWSSFLHMCGRTGRLGNVGWVYTVADKSDAPHVRAIAEELHVDVCSHTVDASLQQLPARDVHRWSKAPELYGLDPQYVVRQHSDWQSENPDAAYREREFYSQPVVKHFQYEDYTPVEEKQLALENARKLAQDIERDPSLAQRLQERGLLRPDLKPTAKLRRLLKRKTTKGGPSLMD